MHQVLNLDQCPGKVQMSRWVTSSSLPAAAIATAYLSLGQPCAPPEVRAPTTVSQDPAAEVLC